MSDISDATLKLSSRLLKVNASWQILPTVTQCNIRMPDTPDEQIKAVPLDYEMNELPSQVWCLRLATIEKDEGRSLHGSNIILILTMTDEGPKTFRRVGVTVLYNTGLEGALCKMLECAPEQTIDLV